MNNSRYWSTMGVNFETIRYDYGVNRLSSLSSNKYIQSLKRMIWNRDINLDNPSTPYHILVIDVITDDRYPGKCIVVRAFTKKEMFESRDAFIDFVSDYQRDWDTMITKFIDELKIDFMDPKITNAELSKLLNTSML